MTTLGYVVIEYNQASRRPSVWSHDTIYDSEVEAQEFAREARAKTAETGRGETYDIALIQVVDPHAAYADPINGGYGGYQAACWDCNWRDDVVYDAGRDGKSRAQETAARHRRETTT